MKPVCPFVKAARPDDLSSKRSGENTNKHSGENEVKMKKDTNDSASVSPKCPFGYEGKMMKDTNDSATISPKCPFGYDLQTFKLGPLSCMICQALLFESSKCMPCSHVFCKACILRFKDCPLCGADIEKIEDDSHLQSVVDRFIEGHARIKRSHASTNEGDVDDNRKVVYEDVSLERGAFLVQQAMRAFRAQNLESAKSRLKICAEDIRGQVETSGHTSELCSQLGAVLGMLGDCCRAIGDSASAVNYFEECVEFLSKLPADDLEIIHTHSVSLNKIGDLKYYDGDLESAKSYYIRALNVRCDAMKGHPDLPSLTLDVAVSLAKVADIDRNIGNENAAVERFREAIALLESMTSKSEEANLQQRLQSVLEFLHSQLVEKQPDAAA